MREVQVATAGLDVTSTGGDSPSATRAPARTLLRPGWPLALLFYGFPLWWALGLAHFSFLLASVPMAIQLLRRSPLRVPRWFGLWLVFLVWVLFGFLTLYTHAPGTQYGAGLGRVFNFGLNYAWYLAATIVLLYIYNLRESELTTTRIQRMVGWMFIVTALFGLAGTLDPGFQFTSLMEHLVPGGGSHASFIHSMIHPQLASASDLLGYEQPRPIAPFMYANAWGNNLAMFAPMFMAAWFASGVRWRLYVGIGICLVAAIPIIHSLNRGMWMGLVLALVYTVVRFAIAGHTRPLNLTIVALVLGSVAFVVSPLYATVTDRLQHPHSNERRGNLATEVIGTTVNSPVIGYGGTRQKQGGYASIASADSTRCGSCGAPSLGTQGYLWLLILGSGYVGAALCLMFLLSQFLSAVRGVDTTSMVAAVSILMSLVFFLVYDSLGSPLFTLMIAIAVHARAKDRPHVVPAALPSGRVPRRRGRELAVYGRFVRRNIVLLAVFTAVGGLIGGALALSSPRLYTASTPALMSRVPMYVDVRGVNTSPAVTIDTDAQLYLRPAVSRRVAKRTGIPVDQVTARTLITAKPLTRVLNVTFRGGTPAIAATGSEQTVRGMLNQRHQLLMAKVPTQLLIIRRNLGKLQDTRSRMLARGASSSTPKIVKLTDQIQILQDLSSQLQGIVAPGGAGQMIGPATIIRVEEARIPAVWAGSGAALGFILALALAWFRPTDGWVSLVRRRRRPIPGVWDVSASGAG